ncbi:MAG: hypothetical protein J6K17_09710 [Oscillospiraceae bacterium]|nr:hypothetical protein [Oscillospiraceae bacterium]
MNNVLLVKAKISLISCNKLFRQVENRLSANKVCACFNSKVSDIFSTFLFNASLDLISTAIDLC